MASKQNFTPEEWTKISESVMLAGMAVSAAEPSGLWGTLKEAFASSSAVAAAKADAGSNELIKAVIAHLETSEGRSAIQEALRTQFTGAKPSEIVQRSLATLREVSAILNAKAPGDAAAFKAWLQAISQRVAEAFEAIRLSSDAGWSSALDVCAEGIQIPPNLSGQGSLPFLAGKIRAPGTQATHDWVIGPMFWDLRYDVIGHDQEQVDSSAAQE